MAGHSATTEEPQEGRLAQSCARCGAARRGVHRRPRYSDACSQLPPRSASMKCSRPADRMMPARMNATAVPSIDSASVSSVSTIMMQSDLRANALRGGEQAMQPPAKAVAIIAQPATKSSCAAADGASSPRLASERAIRMLTVSGTIASARMSEVQMPTTIWAEVRRSTRMGSVQTHQKPQQVKRPCIVLRVAAACGGGAAAALSAGRPS
eukprot:3797812-Prymnesium_polylepis.2